ncbi:glycosyltransferase family 4 protein [Lachnoclostridium sp. Marseille-P6806]|uniref:glycosyltransferase family 4 protein n=1 Tax=Lachnoclostridium sp. Marseille-P6806 TaxID=2364793 RepID=UPI0010308D97|nr:glycosyltransferase family 4 protein [Lachnoclostridium sp. Marseille-P6806]
MKVLIINKFLYPNGGSETYIFRLGEELQRQGHEVQYFGMEHAGRIVGNRVGSYTEPMDFHAGTVRKLLYPFRIIYSREARRKLRPVLEDFQPDAVHLNNINFQLTPSVIDELRSFEEAHRELYAEQSRRLAVVYTAHDSQWVCPGHLLRIPSTGALCMDCIDGDFRGCTVNRCIHNSRLRSVLGTREAEFYKRRGTYAQVDRVICPSGFMNRVLSHDPVLKERAVTLRNFLDLPGQNGAPAENIAGKEQRETAVPEPGGYVFYFGRYSEEKGIATMMKAVRALPEIPFVFAGSGPLEAEVEGANVTKLGFLSGQRLADAIRGARFVVFPSECYENCPFSVMEAQGLGTPVLASDLGGIPELINTNARDGRDTGRLFRAMDEEDLAEKIRELWEDPEAVAAMASHCAGWTAERFDTPERYVHRVTALYSEASRPADHGA